MALPVVAVVGRPNVGKSSLFNWLAGRRIAIVDPTAGVTRDRLGAPVAIGDRTFELVDTGGIGIVDVDDLTEDISRQIEMAIEEAAVILFVVDVRASLMPLDITVAERLRLVSKPVIVVVNKCDTPELDPQAAEFFRLGRGMLVPVSAQNNRGRQELLTRIAESLPPSTGNELVNDDEVLSIAIVGRRNTGKSTFINSLARADRVIVSAVPGTTRDSVDVRFERDGKAFIAIDTAGVRKKRSLANDLEYYSLHRAERSIRRADVVLLFLDAKQRISKVDKQLAEYILKHHKAAIFVVNKWDLARPLPTGEFADYLHATFPSLDYVPIAFVTAREGKNVYAVLNLAQTLYKQAGQRVGTGDLNRVLRMAVEAQAPPMRQNRRPKIFYATQAGTHPPTIVLFTNGPELFDNSYQRYLLKTFRDHLPFTDVPIKMALRKRQRDESGSVSTTDKDEDALPKATKTPVARPERSQGKKGGDGLPFRTKAREDETVRDEKHFESEIWKDL